MPAPLTFLADKLADDFRDGVYDDDVADALTRNLNPALALRPYQAHALATFRYYWEEYRARRKPLREKPAHLLLNMATGSGKTLLMAANMLALYQQGYRRFVFVVNSRNIVEKTRANFTDPGSPKYLFAPQVELDGRRVTVTPVESFEGSHPDDLSLLFTTIQKLQSDLRTPREQGLSYDDLARHPLVLLADEAHHLNKATLSKKEAEEEETTWEATMMQLLHQRPDNVLLEYTATVDFTQRALAEKYHDKLLVRYSLREFRQDGYSKEIRLLKSGESRWARVAQALLLSQWRLKVYNAAPAPGLASPYAPFKPVVLFKSPGIDESKAFFKSFGEWLDELTGERLAELTTHPGPTLQRALAWFAAHGLTLARVADELRQAFRPDRCIIVNSQNDSEAKQLELNQLEGGPIRAVFTVNMLVEGWDVLNLYDIVRLDEGNGVNATGKPKKSTTQEAQLLGRGARYFPWQRPGHDAESHRRKLDTELGNPLRGLEELYYHSIADNKYINALTAELMTAGIYDPRNDENATPRTVRVKPAFKQLPLWETGLLYTNARVPVGSERRVSLRGSYAGTALGIAYELPPDGTTEATVFGAEIIPALAGPDRLPYAVPLHELGLPVLRKALESYPFFEFRRLRQLLPQLTSVRELLTADEYLGQSTFTLTATEAQRQALRPHQRLAAARHVFGALQTLLSQRLPRYVGSDTFTGRPLKNYLTNDRVTVAQDGDDREVSQPMTNHPDPALRLDVGAADWLVYDEFYGTSEEKYFIRYLAAALPELQKRFQDIYLLRNDKLFQLYAFDDGRAFEPDFVLFLTERITGKSLSWQVFVEPKGGHLRPVDQWKEYFLLRIHDRATNAGARLLFENEEVVLHGLPFYTHAQEAAFTTCFEQVLLNPAVSN